MYEPPVLRVRVAPPIVLTDDARSPDEIFAATRRDGFPCWDPLVAAWSERRPPAAATVFRSLEQATAARLVVAFSSSRAPSEGERGAIGRLLVGGTQAVVIVVREPAFAPDPDSCHLDADAWELALVDGFDRICVRQWIWSAAVPDDAWAEEMRTLPPTGGIMPASPSSWDTLWLAGAVFGGVRSRGSRKDP